MSAAGVAKGRPAARSAPSMSALLFDQKQSRWPWLLVSLLPVGVGVHLLLIMLGARLEASVEKPLLSIEVELVSAPKPAPKPPAPEPPAPEPPPQRSEPKPEAVKPLAPPEKPPAAPPPKATRPKEKAKAGKVLAAATTDSSVAAAPFVEGDGGSYAGGETSSTGTSDTAVEAEPEEAAAAQPPPVPLAPPPVVKPKAEAVAATKAYLQQVRQELARHQRYPLAARRLNHEGSVVVSFVIDGQGRFSQLEVERSSGSDLLDEAALECVSQLSGKVARPAATGDLELRLKTSLKFQLAADEQG